jgi:hypothetical protein
MDAKLSRTQILFDLKFGLGLTHHTQRIFGPRVLDWLFD